MISSKIVSCTIKLIVLNVYIMNAQISKYNALTDAERKVIIDKGTEYPGTGIYLKNRAEGIYICKQCNAPLFHSSHKFDSECGWPSFDDEIRGAVKTLPDADGNRTEIVCENCNGHLGHMFLNEGFTVKNKRDCVNSISIKFIKKGIVLPEMIPNIEGAEIAYFASGCFWGTEFFMQRAEGVLNTTVGYLGGDAGNPSYEDVCSGNTGYAETVKVVFDKSKTSFEQLAKLFFETHDPTQLNRQGPDIGSQYRSAIFYINDNQRDVAISLVDVLKSKGMKIATEITPAKVFYEAEKYHQNYYGKMGGRPYCHSYRKLF